MAHRIGLAVSKENPDLNRGRDSCFLAGICRFMGGLELH